ncbi:MAG TPA: hypothetical protein VFR84_12205 [Candidatus Angelobacter sp.]|nr:hypothetical protein [Candidatus Angelobacter sp.]
MSRTQIFTIFILVDLAIVAGVVFCVFQRLPVSKYLVPAIVLFTLNGLWLVVMTVRTTPPGGKSGDREIR